MALRAPSTAVAVRVITLVFAIATGLAVVGLERDRNRCSEAGKVLFLGPASQSPERYDAALKTLPAQCATSPATISGSASLVRDGRAREAARLARVAVAAEPENWASWTALGLALRGDSVPEARAAIRRARALNPFEASPPPG